MKTVLLARSGSGTMGSRSALLAASLVVAATLFGCKDDAPPPPLPEAKPAVTPTTLELEIPEEDSGAEEEPVKTGKGGVRKPKGLAACCAALRQNAANAPPETQGHMLNAASACDAANAAGAGSVAGLSGLLRGAQMPPACQ